MGLNQKFLPLMRIHIIDNPPREKVFSGHTRTWSQRSLFRALARTAKVYRVPGLVSYEYSSIIHVCQIVLDFLPVSEVLLPDLVPELVEMYTYINPL